jgi:cell division protein FtsB
MSEHNQHWRNPETGQIECECCCKWALDYERLEQENRELRADNDRMKGGRYYHDVHCSAKRDLPMGEGGCSCTMYQRASSAEATNARLEAENARLKAPVSERPKIVCLCGSTRFIDMFAVKTWELERHGHIVLGCTLLPEWYCNVSSHFGEATGTKEQCDELHKRKIDLADEILVLNIDGYIGDSTRSEIEYASNHGKPVFYLETLAARASGKEKDND